MFCECTVCLGCMGFLDVCMYVYGSVCLSVCPSACLSVCLSVCLLHGILCLCLSVSVCVCVCLCVSVCVSVMVMPPHPLTRKSPYHPKGGFIGINCVTRVLAQCFCADLPSRKTCRHVFKDKRVPAGVLPWIKQKNPRL